MSSADIGEAAEAAYDGSAASRLGGCEPFLKRLEFFSSQLETHLFSKFILTSGIVTEMRNY